MTGRNTLKISDTIVSLIAEESMTRSLIISDFTSYSEYCFHCLTNLLRIRAQLEV